MTTNFSAPISRAGPDQPSGVGPTATSACPASIAAMRSVLRRNSTRRTDTSGYRVRQVPSAPGRMPTLMENRVPTCEPVPRGPVIGKPGSLPRRLGSPGLQSYLEWTTGFEPAILTAARVEGRSRSPTRRREHRRRCIQSVLPPSSQRLDRFGEWLADFLRTRATPGPVDSELARSSNSPSENFSRQSATSRLLISGIEIYISRLAEPQPRPEKNLRVP